MSLRRMASLAQLTIWCGHVLDGIAIAFERNHDDESYFFMT